MEPITASAARLAGSSLLRLQSDDRLAKLAALDNHAAFEALVARYRAPLQRACRKLLSDAAAEDAVQQAFLRTHQALLRNGPPDRLRPWLYKIAVNSALAIASERPETLPLDEERLDGVERPDEAYERRESLRATVGAIGSLPEGQRRALVARELEGRSHDEIAAELGLSAGAARQLIHRARAGVRAAATALTPVGLLERLLAVGGAQGAPVAEIAAGGVAGGAATKLAVAALVAGGAIGGAALAPLENSDGERQVAAGKAPGANPEGPATVGSAGSGGGEPGASADGSSGSSSSGPEGGEDGGRDHDGSEGPAGGHSNKGPGGGEPEDDEFENDPEDDDVAPTSSGHGSSGSGSSGDGSSGSGSSGSGPSSSSGSGSSGSGSSGSGSSGSGSSGSGSGGEPEAPEPPEPPDDD